MPKLSTRQRTRQLREQAILRAAAHTVDERGYARLNMDDLAKAVGISKPTLYQHFRSKDDLVAHALLSMVQHVEAQLDGAHHSQAAAQLDGVLRCLLQGRYAPDGFPSHLLQDHSAVWQVLAHHPDVVQARTRLTARLVVLVGRAKDDGAVDAGLPDLLVIGMMFALSGLMDEAKFAPSTPPPPLLLAEALVQVFWRGVAPAAGA